MFIRNLQVRFSECDGLGHVNNANYFNYMEDARMDVFRIFHPTLDLDGWNLIVASTRCEFLAQVTYADELTIHTWISKVGNASVVVEHAIRNQHDAYVARGQAVLILYDYNMQRSQSVSDDVRQVLSQHVSAPDNAPTLRN